MGGQTNVKSPYEIFHPFNESDHYHHVCHTGLCSTAPDSFCTVANEDYKFNSTVCEVDIDSPAYTFKMLQLLTLTDFRSSLMQEGNPRAIQQCDAYTGLRDLNQSDSFVRNETLEWVRWITTVSLSVDGPLRIWILQSIESWYDFLTL